MLARSNDKSNERDQHSRYVELSALLTTGALSAEDLEDLNAHLAACGECRMLVADFQQIVHETLPLLAMGREPEIQEGVEWREEKSKRRLFAAIEGQGNETPQARCLLPADLQAVSRYFGFCAILILVGIAGYVIGTRQHPQPTTQLASSAQLSRDQTQSESSLALRIADLTR